MGSASCAWIARGHTTATQDTKKFPPLHVNTQRAIVSGQLSALIGAGFESLVAKS
jgi:hypothetical protein